MKTFLRLIQIMLPVWPTMLLAAGFGWITIAANIGLMVTSALLIATAALHPSIAELSVAIVGVRFFGVARAAFRYLERYVSHDATFRILSQMRVWFYQRLEPLAPAQLQSWQSGELFSAIVGDVETLKDFYLRVIAPPLVAFLILIGMLLFLKSFSHGLMVLLISAFVLVGILLPMAVRHINRNCGHELVAARTELKACLVDTVNGMAELAAFDRKQQQFKAICQLNGKVLGLQGRVATVNSVSDAMGNLIMNGTLWGALWLAIPLVSSGQLEGVYLAAIALGIQSSFEAVLPLPMAMHYWHESLAAARRLFQIVETPVPLKSSSSLALPPTAAVTVQHLSFEYDSWGTVLQDISFSLPVGKRIAIVGPSGAGKSTIVNLLLRFWEFERGAILMGGQDYRKLDPEAIRRMFSVVSQQTHIFNATVRDNLLMARPEASEQEVARAVQDAALDEFISRLPQGLDTAVGHNGQALSGGQRQRIAIARALLKNAPILLLDEPTVGLDAVTEQQIMQAVQKIMHGRTTLLISHSLTGLESMDEILVLDQGLIVERGTFTELVNQQGLFAELRYFQKV